jgi:hypothetical protein
MLKHARSLMAPLAMVAALLGSQSGGAVNLAPSASSLELISDIADSYIARYFVGMPRPQIYVEADASVFQRASEKTAYAYFDCTNNRIVLSPLYDQPLVAGAQRVARGLPIDLGNREYGLGAASDSIKHELVHAWVAWKARRCIGNTNDDGGHNREFMIKAIELKLDLAGTLQAFAGARLAYNEALAASTGLAAPPPAAQPPGQGRKVAEPPRWISGGRSYPSAPFVALRVDRDGQGLSLTRVFFRLYDQSDYQLATAFAQTAIGQKFVVSSNSYVKISDVNMVPETDLDLNSAASQLGCTRLVQFAIRDGGVHSIFVPADFGQLSRDDLRRAWLLPLIASMEPGDVDAVDPANAPRSGYSISVKEYGAGAGGPVGRLVSVRLNYQPLVQPQGLCFSRG